jgi:hypothetical protein
MEDFTEGEWEILGMEAQLKRGFDERGEGGHG